MRYRIKDSRYDSLIEPSIFSASAIFYGRLHPESSRQLEIHALNLTVAICQGRSAVACYLI